MGAMGVGVVGDDRGARLLDRTCRGRGDRRPLRCICFLHAAEISRRAEAAAELLGRGIRSPPSHLIRLSEPNAVRPLHDDGRSRVRLASAHDLPARLQHRHQIVRGAAEVETETVCGLPQPIFAGRAVGSANDDHIYEPP